MKGLEFRCIAAIGVNDRAFPLYAAVTPVEVDTMQHKVDMLAERSLVFVACARARADLYVSCTASRTPSYRTRERRTPVVTETAPVCRVRVVDLRR